MENEDDKEFLKDALSNEPAATEEPAQQPGPEVEAGQPRDEQGRFAAKQEETQEPVAEQPTGQAPAKQDTQDHRIPLRELLDEREKRQQAAAEAQELRRQIEHLSRLIGQQQQPQRVEQPAQPPDLFQDPDAYFQHRIDPLRQEAGGAIQAINQRLEMMSREWAVDKFGAEAVDAAYTDLAKRLQTGTGQYDYQEIMSSPHPYAALVQWHKKQTALSKVGSDPEKWLEAELAKRLEDDTFLAKAIEKARAKQQASPGSGRPAINLPPSLSRTPSSMGTMDDANTDEDDAALLKSALRR